MRRQKRTHRTRQRRLALRVWRAWFKNPARNERGEVIGGSIFGSIATTDAAKTKGGKS